MANHLEVSSDSSESKYPPGNRDLGDGLASSSQQTSITASLSLTTASGVDLSNTIENSHQHVVPPPPVNPPMSNSQGQRNLGSGNQSNGTADPGRSRKRKLSDGAADRPLITTRAAYQKMMAANAEHVRKMYDVSTSVKAATLSPSTVSRRKAQPSLTSVSRKDTKPPQNKIETSSPRTDLTLEPASTLSPVPQPSPQPSQDDKHLEFVRETERRKTDNARAAIDNDAEAKKEEIRLRELEINLQSRRIELEYQAHQDKLKLEREQIKNAERARLNESLKAERDRKEREQARQAEIDAQKREDAKARAENERLLAQQKTENEDRDRRKAADTQERLRQNAMTPESTSTVQLVPQPPTVIVVQVPAPVTPPPPPSTVVNINVNVDSGYMAQMMGQTSLAPRVNTLRNMEALQQQIIQLPQLLEYVPVGDRIRSRPVETAVSQLTRLSAPPPQLLPNRRQLGDIRQPRLLTAPESDSDSDEEDVEVEDDKPVKKPATKTPSHREEDDAFSRQLYEDEQSESQEDLTEESKIS